MTGSTPRSVALAAGGAAWETQVVRELEAAPSLLLARRCMDVAELLAVAGASADVAVVDVELPGLDVETITALGRRGVQVVGLGPSARADALGVVLHSRPGEVEAAVVSATVDRPASPPAEPASAGPDGRVVAVWGPQGAPGRSTVALALAAELAHRGRSTVLVDADTYGGSQAQLVGLLDDVSGLMAACREANRGSTDVAADHVVAVAENLHLLTGLPRADMWRALRPAGLERVLQELRRGHRDVVVDCGFCLEQQDATGPGRNQATLQVLEVADVVVAVGRADPVGIARLVRGLHDLRSVVDTSPRVVLNQTRPTLGWDQRELVETVQRLGETAPVALVPADVPALDAATMAGQLPHVVAPSSPFVTALARLADATLTSPLAPRAVAR
ncbi:CpaE family protein [Aeromicrobium sp. CF4.19]|uniref:AAA family ATPase n=1 Tax=Aeromicrobium sp. CF4.19 TaxID=3373082 RepID=UPI003EE7E97E